MPSYKLAERNPGQKKIKNGNKSEDDRELLLELQDAHGNAEIQELLRGPAGRVFSNIVGTDSADVNAVFGETQLRNYLETSLGFAEGEWFRGKKVDGAAEAMLSELDTNNDSQVNWSEFSSIADQLLESVAPELKNPVNEEEVEMAAGQQFSKIPGSLDQVLDLNELKMDSLQRLPDNIEHKDLVAQLAARLAMDAIDLDEKELPVAERGISLDEWVKAAIEMADVH